MLEFEIVLYETNLVPAHAQCNAERPPRTQDTPSIFSIHTEKKFDIPVEGLPI